MVLRFPQMQTHDPQISWKEKEITCCVSSWDVPLTCIMSTTIESPETQSQVEIPQSATNSRRFSAKPVDYHHTTPMIVPSSSWPELHHLLTAFTPCKPKNVKSWMSTLRLWNRGTFALWHHYHQLASFWRRKGQTTTMYWLSRPQTSHSILWH